MARSSMRAPLLSLFTRRDLSTYTHKFSLVKLSRNQPSSHSPINPYMSATEGLEHPEISPSSPTASSTDVGAAAATASASTERKAGTIWWGPDSATGMWAPASTTADIIGKAHCNISDNASVQYQEQAWFREDVHL